MTADKIYGDEITYQERSTSSMLHSAEMLYFNYGRVA